jgi:hypothetical protein
VLNPNDPANRQINVGVITIAYTMAFRKNNIFETMGIVEEQLHEKATRFTTELESVANILKTGFAVDSRSIASVLSLFDAFYSDFGTWREQDTHVSVNKMIVSLRQLYIATASRASDRDPEDGHAISVQAQTQLHIEKLRSNLVLCGCQAELDRLDAWRNDTLSFPEKVKSIVGFGHTNMDFLPESLEFYIERALFRANIHGLSSVNIVHEVLVDSSFRVEVNTSFHINGKKVNRDFIEVYWNEILDDLKRPDPIYTAVFDALLQCRAGLYRVADASSPLAEEIMTTTMTDGRLLDDVNATMELFEKISSLICRVQVKEREDSFKSEWGTIQSVMKDTPTEKMPEMVCLALRFFSEHVEVMHIDAFNGKIDRISEIINANGVDFERADFQAKMNQGLLTITRTTEWLYKEISNITVRRFRELVNDDEGAFRSVYQSALVNLIADPAIDVYKVDDIPEVLHLDLHRVNHISGQFRKGVNYSVAMRVISYYSAQDQPGNQARNEAQNESQNEAQNEAQNEDQNEAQNQAGEVKGLDLQGILTCVSNIVIACNPMKLEDIGPLFDALEFSPLEELISAESMDSMRAEMELAFSDPHYAVRVTV